MAGVWVFQDDGVMRLVENPGSDATRKHLVHLASGEVITSYAVLESKLACLGWERYRNGDPQLLQYHKSCTADLISLPRDFSRFRSVHMYDIVVKTRNEFQVRDARVPNTNANPRQQKTLLLYPQ